MADSTLKLNWTFTPMGLSEDVGIHEAKFAGYDLRVTGDDGYYAMIVGEGYLQSCLMPTPMLFSEVGEAKIALEQWAQEKKFIAQAEWQEAHETLKATYTLTYGLWSKADTMGLPQASGLADIANKALEALQSFEQQFWAWKN